MLPVRFVLVPNIVRPFEISLSVEPQWPKYRVERPRRVKGLGHRARVDRLRGFRRLLDHLDRGVGAECIAPGHKVFRGEFLSDSLGLVVATRIAS